MNLKEVFIHQLHRNAQKDKLDYLDRELTHLEKELKLKKEILIKESSDVDDLRGNNFKTLITRLRLDFKDRLSKEEKEAEIAYQEYQKAVELLDAKKVRRSDFLISYNAIPNYKSELEEKLLEKKYSLADDRVFQSKLNVVKLKLQRNSKDRISLIDLQKSFIAFEIEYDQFRESFNYLRKQKLHLEFFGEGDQTSYMKRKFKREFSDRFGIVQASLIPVEELLTKIGINSKLSILITKLVSMVKIFVNSTYMEPFYDDSNSKKRKSTQKDIESEIDRIRLTINQRLDKIKAAIYHLREEEIYLIVEYNTPSRK